MSPRGGKRDGSGRRRLGEEPRVHLSVTVDARTAGALQARAKAEHLSLGIVLDRMVLSAEAPVPESIQGPEVPEKAAQVAPKPVARPKATKEELTVNGGVITQAIIDTFKKCVSGHDLDWAFAWAKASWGKDVALRLLDLFRWHKV